MRSAACFTLLLIIATPVAAGFSPFTFALGAQEPPVPQEQAQEPEEQAEEVPAAQVPLVIPDEEKARKNPFDVDEEFLALGKKLYRSQCRMCHGETGRGEGDLAEEMKLTMSDFTTADTKKKTEGELHYILSKGHGRMPGQGERLRPQQLWSMVTYIRTLTPPKEAAAEEKPKE